MRARHQRLMSIVLTIAVAVVLMPLLQPDLTNTTIVESDDRATAVPIRLSDSSAVDIIGFAVAER